MRIALRFKDDVAIISLSGKFIAGSDGPFLRQKVKDLMEAGTRKLVFDFADVPYIDSTGLGFLAGSREAAEQAGARIILASINQHVMRILDGVKLTQFFEIENSEEAAIAKVHELNAAATAASSASGSDETAATKTPRARKRTATPPAE